MSRRTEIGVRARGLAFLFLAMPGAAVSAGLDLPARTVVVRDFARLRQDLLDTLKVNLPDATVDILQFRGADVVLSVGMRQKELPASQAEALAQLRRYCDRLIRSAAPGMRLAPSSTLVLEAAPETSGDEGTRSDILDRLRTALGDSEAASGATTGEASGEDPEPPLPDLLQSGLKAYLARATERLEQDSVSGPESRDEAPSPDPGASGLPGHLDPHQGATGTSRFAPADLLALGSPPRIGSPAALRAAPPRPLEVLDPDPGATSHRSSEETVRELYRRIHEDLAVTRVHADLRTALDRPPEPVPAASPPVRTLAAAPRSARAGARVPPPGPGRKAQPRPPPRTPGSSGSLFDLFDSGTQSDLAEPPVLDGTSP